MKPTILIIAIIALACTLQSCTKKTTTTTPTTTTPTTPTTPTTTTPTPAFSVKINGGSTLTGSVLNAHKSTAGVVTANLSANVTYNGATWMIPIAIKGYAGAKTYDSYTSIDTLANVSVNNLSNTTITYSAWQVFYNTSGATVVVTKDDGTYIQGTFSGTVYKGTMAPTDSMKVTAGTFVFKWN